MQRLLPLLPDDVQFDFACEGDMAASLFGEIHARNGYRVIRTPARTNPFTSLLFYYRLIRAGRYDVVHTHIGHFGCYALLAAWVCGVDCRVAHAHSRATRAPLRPPFQGLAPLVRAAALALAWLGSRAANVWLAVSSEAALDLFGVPIGAQAKWFPPCFSMPEGDSEEGGTLQAQLRRELDIPAGAKVLLFAGRLYESALFGDVKNLSFALRIHATLWRRGIASILLVAGDGPHRDRLEARAEDMGIRDTVRFLGHRDDLPNLLRYLADVCVFPSFHEGLGLAAIEAQAARVPVLISEGFPDEACVLSSRVYRCRLADGVESWATVLEQVFAEVPSRLSGINPGEIDPLKMTLFDPRRNMSALLELYHG